MTHNTSDKDSPKGKYKAVAVSYLNTKPLLYGLLDGQSSEYLDLSLAIPSECARMLKAGEVDMALAPVAILPELENYHLISDFCIGATGAVKTVCIYSEVPLEQITHLYLDHHSRTSAALVKILLKDYWQHEVVYLSAAEGYIEKIGTTIAGLVIGDRTIDMEGRFEYVYDLGEYWTKMTGLPFVFAAWISLKELDISFLNAFNEDLSRGIKAIPKLQLLLPSPDPSFDLKTYFTKYISYDFDENKHKGLDLFLEKIGQKAVVSL